MDRRALPQHSHVWSHSGLSEARVRITRWDDVVQCTTAGLRALTHAASACGPEPVTQSPELIFYHVVVRVTGVKHVFWLRDGVIAGRSGPNRNAWNPRDFADAGIGAVLSVNDGEFVHARDFAEVGIAYQCVPLSDAAPPQTGDVDTCIAALPKAMGFVLNAIDAGRAVLVHCTSGKDRTGMFLGYYLCVTEAMAPRQAIQELRRVRPVALSAEGWEDLAVKVLTALRA